jgi:hypothetical protein
MAKANMFMLKMFRMSESSRNHKSGAPKAKLSVVPMNRLAFKTLCMCAYLCTCVRVPLYLCTEPVTVHVCLYDCKNMNVYECVCVCEGIVLHTALPVSRVCIRIVQHWAEIAV